MPYYIEAHDENMRTHDSPLDPWGLLTPIEKAAAATVHAHLVRIPRIPRPARPPLTDEQRRDRKFRSVTTEGITRCVFGCYTSTVISHYVNAIGVNGQSQYLWGPVCTDCAASCLRYPEDYTLTALVPSECPNSWPSRYSERCWHTNVDGLVATAHLDYPTLFTVRARWANGDIVSPHARCSTLLEARQCALQLSRLARWGNGRPNIPQADIDNVFNPL